jgi:hypothetical protein
MNPSSPTPASSEDQRHHDLLTAADRLAIGVRTEDPETIRVLAYQALGFDPHADAPCACSVPVSIPLQDAVDALVAMAVQVNTDVEFRRRMAWTLDVDAVNDVPVHQRASVGYAGSAGWGALDKPHRGPGSGKAA